jgi:hypothetical protein
LARSWSAVAADSSSSGVMQSEMLSVSATSTKISGSPSSLGWKKP